jgi:hypothetical protein
MLLCTLGALVAGCAGGTPLGEQVPTTMGGLPADVPPRPSAQAPTPAVHDLPPSRADAPLDAAGQKKLESDLAAERVRHQKLEEPGAAKRAEGASAANRAALERAKKAAKPPPKPATQ